MRARAWPAGDAGVTLQELVVAMSLMAVFGSIFVGGMTQMFSSANRTEQQVAAQAQLRLAFLRLDREIRYAVGISEPGATEVEYATERGGDPYCTALRLSGGQLQARTWAAVDLPGSWLPLASGVAQIADTRPFDLVQATDPISFEGLRIRLVATQGDTATQLDATFSALNSGTGTTGDDDPTAPCVARRSS